MVSHSNSSLQWPLLVAFSFGHLFPFCGVCSKCCWDHWAGVWVSSFVVRFTRKYYCWLVMQRFIMIGGFWPDTWCNWHKICLVSLLRVIISMYRHVCMLQYIWILVIAVSPNPKTESSALYSKIHLRCDSAPLEFLNTVFWRSSINLHLLTLHQVTCKNNALHSLTSARKVRR